MEDTRAIHDRVHALCLSRPKRFFGMASITPHFRPEDYEAEARRCIKELGFCALKITPIGHAVNPDSKDGRFVFEVAESLNVPVMVHTGIGAPFADPAQMLFVAKDFKKVPIVLAHAGTDYLFSQALYLAQTYEHVYLEPSWVGTPGLHRAINSIGPSKLMFSSDHPDNIPVELAKYRALLKGDDLERVLSGTAIEVFNLQVN